MLLTNVYAKLMGTMGLIPPQLIKTFLYFRLVGMV